MTQSKIRNAVWVLSAVIMWSGLTGCGNDSNVLVKGIPTAVYTVTPSCVSIGGPIGFRNLQSVFMSLMTIKGGLMPPSQDPFTEAGLYFTSTTVNVVPLIAVSPFSPGVRGTFETVSNSKMTAGLTLTVGNPKPLNSIGSSTNYTATGFFQLSEGVQDAILNDIQNGNSYVPQAAPGSTVTLQNICVTNIGFALNLSDDPVNPTKVIIDGGKLSLYLNSSSIPINVIF